MKENGTKLPKLYRPVWITFDSLRDGFGSGLGVIHDVDTEVTRKCRRVVSDGGWKWQICDADKLAQWDHLIEVDQISLAEYPYNFKLASFKGDKNG